MTKVSTSSKLDFGCNQLQLRMDLIKSRFQSKIRGLNQAAKWASELLDALPIYEDKKLDDFYRNLHVLLDSKFYKSKDYLDLNEYERAAFFTENSTTKETRFLHYYCLYMAREKRRLDLLADLNNTNVDNSNQYSGFCSIKKELQDLKLSDNLFNDGYLFYVYGIVLSKLDLKQEAIETLITAINFEPLCWSAWFHLSTLIDDKQHLDSLKLPNHWFKYLFLGVVYLELQLNEEAYSLYSELIETFNNSFYLKGQLAVIKHSLRNLDGAIQIFQELRHGDPCNLDFFDVYSNVLYVKGSRADLGSLAHAANQIDPFRVETCCCIANYYSLRAQHNKAIVYFNRALQLKPSHLSAWTLMGHEYMEMKNTTAAVQSYRSALKHNKRDYRAWYGLGQTYEILKMPAYCLYYHSVARSLRPNDSRMIIASGETLEKLERHNDALKCYWKAGALGKLASLYEKLGEKNKAAAAYTDYINVNNAANPSLIDNVSYTNDLGGHANKFLANYFLEKGNFKMAHTYAQNCMNYVESKEEGKAILKNLQQKFKNNDSSF